MLLTEDEGKARGPRVQPTVTADLRQAKRLRLMLGLGLPLLLAPLLGGCSDVPNQANPVAWWHGLEGGAIAKDRPPPPNPHAPFPRIANQPARPAGMPDWEWQQLSAALVAQRSSAQAYATQNPIPTLAPPPTRAASLAPKPVLAPVPTPTPAPTPNSAQTADEAASAAAIARLAAAPAPAGSQAPLPRAAIATATAHASANGQGSADTGGASALTFNGPTAQPSATGPRNLPITPGTRAADASSSEIGTNLRYFDPNNGLSIPGALGPVAQADEATAPPVPATVPAPAVVPGFAIPTVPATYQAPRSVPQPAPYQPPTPPPPVPPVPIRFAPQSAVLTPPMQRALLDLILASHGAHIAVTGFGDAAGLSLPDQAAAMPLALERARAILVQLIADGVKPGGVTTSARALGSGGLARLVD